MKIHSASVLALLVPAISARFVEDHQVGLFTDWAKEVDTEPTKYHIELSPGETRWVTEDEKWALRRVSPDVVWWALMGKPAKLDVYRKGNGSSISRITLISGPSVQRLHLRVSSPRSRRIRS
jgi:hypothetical protein